MVHAAAVAGTLSVNECWMAFVKIIYLANDFDWLSHFVTNVCKPPKLNGCNDFGSGLQSYSICLNFLYQSNCHRTNIMGVHSLPGMHSKIGYLIVESSLSTFGKMLAYQYIKFMYP